MSSHFTDFNSDYPCTHTHTLWHTPLVIDLIPEEPGFRVLRWHPVCRSALTTLRTGCFIAWLKPEVTGSLTLLDDCVGSHQSAEGRGLWRPKATPSEWPCVCPVSHRPPPNPFGLPPPLRQTSQLSHECKASSLRCPSPFRALWSSYFAVMLLLPNSDPLCLVIAPWEVCWDPVLVCSVLCSSSACASWCLLPPVNWDILCVNVCRVSFARRSMPGCGFAGGESYTNLHDLIPDCAEHTFLSYLSPDGYELYVWL